MSVAANFFASENVEAPGTSEKQQAVGIAEESAVIEIVVLQPVRRSEILDFSGPGI